MMTLTDQHLIALHLAKPDAAPIGIYAFLPGAAPPAPGFGHAALTVLPHEALMLLGGSWAVRRGTAATSLLPGATRVMGEDIERMIANGRFANLTRPLFDASWSVEPLQIDVFLTEKNVVDYLNKTANRLDVVDAIAKVLVTRPNAGTYLDVHRFAGSLTETEDLIVTEVAVAGQFHRGAAADKRQNELVEAALDEHTHKRGKTGALHIKIGPGGRVSRAALEAALRAEIEAAEIERQRVENERLAAEAALAAEQKRIADARAKNPAYGMSDEELAEELRKLRGE